VTPSRLTCGTGSGDGSQPDERNGSHVAADESEGGQPLRPGTICHIVSSDLSPRQTSVCSALQIASASTHSAHSPDRIGLGRRHDFAKAANLVEISIRSTSAKFYCMNGSNNGS
jgi:hypothetical protein